MITKDTELHHHLHVTRVASTLMKGRRRERRVGRMLNRRGQLGRILAVVNSEEVEARIQTSHHVLPKVSRRLNDSYSLARSQACLLTGNCAKDRK